MTEATWSLKIESENKIIWTGSLRSSPDIPRLSKLLPITLPFNDLTALTVQVLTSAPIEVIPTLLTALCSVYLRSPLTGSIDMNALSTIAATEHRVVCGKVFKKGDIVWNCRNCGKDPTCVQCDPCFRKSNHVGHEVYFHRAEGGSGCCDCGDGEAWSCHGNCTDHQPLAINPEEYDPSIHLPEEVKKGFRAVLQGCLGWISSFVILSVRSFESLPENMIMNVMRNHYPTQSAVFRVHNDDVHTYEEVIQIFRSVGFTPVTSENLTKQVDKEGSAILLNTTITEPSFDDYYTTVSNGGLIYSLFPTELLPLEKRVPCALTWLITLGEFSDGFRRIISEELLHGPSSKGGEPDCYGHTMKAHHWPELANSFTLQTMFEEEGQFPLEITQLSDIEFLQLTLSARVSHNYDESNVLPTSEEEIKDRIRRPFRYCASNPLSLLLMASPFLNITIQKVLMEIIMKFQHDFHFKSGFSQLITLLYPSLKTLYCRHYGLAAETIFKATVQVYTANSVVELMSSVGISKRPLSEVGIPSPLSLQATTKPSLGRPLLITNALIAVLYTILRDRGCPSQPEFLNDHSIRTHRLSMICRDLEYVTTDPYYCIELLRGQMNPGTIELWIDVVSLVQYIDRMKRQTTIHVEQEDEKWQHGANLLLEVESVSEHFVANGLLTSSNLQMDSREFYSFSSLLAPSRSSTNPATAASAAYLDTLRQEALYNSIEKVLKGIFQWYILKNNDPEQRIMLRFPSNERPHEFICTQYRVSQNAFSVHIPLHRFFMKLLLFGCNGDISCATIFQMMIERYSEKEILLLMDYPLRCLIFYSQVIHGLWKRNGLSASNLAYNYNRIPLNRTLHDMDILAVQVSGVLLPVKTFYFFLFYRYELMDWLMEPIRPISKESIHVLSDVLRLLLQVILYLPIVLFPSDASEEEEGITRFPGIHYEGVRLGLLREVFHQIVIGNASVASLSKFKKVIGTFGTVSDQLLREVVQELTTRRNANAAAASSHFSSGESGTKKPDGNDPTILTENDQSSGNMQLKEESYQYYDPEYPSYSIKQTIQAMDIMKERFKHANSPTQRQERIALNPPRFHGNPYLPLLYEKAIPIAHPDFIQLRLKLICSSFFLEINYRILHHLCLSTEPQKNFHRTTFLGKIIELLTIQCYLLPPPPSETTPTTEKEFITEYRSLFKIHCTGYLVIQQLLSVYQQEILKEETMYQEGLGFILWESRNWSKDIQELLIAQQFLSHSEETATSSMILQNKKSETENNKEKLRKAAHDRLLGQTKARAENAMKAFADLMSDSSDDEDGDDKAEDDEDGSIKKGGGVDVMEIDGQSIKKKKKKVPIVSTIPLENCIICKQKKENMPLGYLCFLQHSNTLKRVNNHYYCHPQTGLYTSINKVYRVVALEGCVIHEFPNELSTILKTIGYNHHVVVGARQGAWYQIVSPVKGYGLFYRERTRHERNASSNSVINAANLVNHSFSLKYVTILAPVKSLLYQKNGGTRLHMSTCSHAMHLDCWDEFFTATYARYINHERGAEHQGYDMSTGEFLCPLCKTILNAVVPIVPDITEIPQNEKEHEKSESIMTSTTTTKMEVDLPSPSSLSSYVSSFFHALRRGNFTSTVSATTVVSTPPPTRFISEEEKAQIVRFLDRMYTTGITMISFPASNLNKVLPFPPTIATLELHQYSNTQIMYETFLTKFLYGDWKLLQSVLLMISSFGYSLSLSSYQNLSNYLNLPQGALTPAAGGGGGESSGGLNGTSADSFWSLTSSEQKLYPQMITILQRIPELFHQYEAREGLPNDHHPAYSLLYKASLLKLFFNSNTSNTTTAEPYSLPASLPFDPELVHALTLFPSIPIIHNLQYDYPDMKTLYDLLIQLCRCIGENKRQEPSTADNADVPHETLYVLSKYYESFSSPLLSQDLTTVMIALVPIISEASSSSASSQRSEEKERWKCLQEFTNLLVLAKVNQILIDPKITKIFENNGQSPSSSSSSSFQKGNTWSESDSPTVNNTILHDEQLRSLYSKISSLQTEIYSLLQFPSNINHHNINNNTSHRRMIIGNQLLQEIFQSLIPYLEILVRFHQLLSIKHFPEEEEDEGSDRMEEEEVEAVRSIAQSRQLLLSSLKEGTSLSLEERNTQLFSYITTLHQELGIPSLLNLLQERDYLELMRGWNHAYHHYHLTAKTTTAGTDAVSSFPVNWLLEQDHLEENRSTSLEYLDPISALKPLPPGSDHSPLQTSGGEESEEHTEDAQLLQLLQQSSASYVYDSLNERPTEEGILDSGDGIGGGEVNDALNDMFGTTGAGNATTDNNGLQDLILQLLRRGNRNNGGEDEEEDDDGEEDDAPADESREEERMRRNIFQTLFQRLRTGPGRGNNATPPNNNNANELFPPFPPIRRGRRAGRGGGRGNTPTNASNSNVSSTSAKKNRSVPWPYYGVFPSNAFFDELPSSNFPNHAFLRLFANYPIRKPLQSSVTGHYPIYTLNTIPASTSSTETAAAMMQFSSYQYPDLSHFNMTLDCLQNIYQKYLFIELPLLYIDLYHMAKFPEGSNGVTLEDPAICLLCGEIMCAGRKRTKEDLESAVNPGECTLHAMTCGAGVGVFFIIQSCYVLMVRGSRSSYYATIYLDEHNESNADNHLGYGHNKPMFLSQKRYQKIKEIYLQHAMAKEITRKRVTADNVIRQYWY